MQPTNLPVTIDRSPILDILRGIALLGICLANYPILSFYAFQSPEVWETFPTRGIDHLLQFLSFAFIEGKFYTLFSLLFGIGFSIILKRNQSGGSRPLTVYYRRLAVLILFGLAHSLLLWIGDILLLYGLLALFLPLFRNASDKTLITLWVLLVLSPILFDVVKVATENRWNLSHPFTAMLIRSSQKTGITDVSRWLIDHDTFADNIRFCSTGIWFRWEQLMDTNRLPKVFGTFLLGFYVGRNMIYAKLEENRRLIKKTWQVSGLLGIPFSLAMAWFEMDGRHLPDVYGLTDTISYALGVVQLSLFITTSVCLLFLKADWRKRLMVFAPVGRMALTNYILQTLAGMAIFYGMGLGLGARTGLVYVLLIAVAVYLAEVALSNIWFRYFQYGPLEWIWRQLTYGKRLPLRKTS